MKPKTNLFVNFDFIFNYMLTAIFFWFLSCTDVQNDSIYSDHKNLPLYSVCLKYNFSMQHGLKLCAVFIIFGQRAFHVA